MSFDRCADGMLPGEHGHFSPSRVLSLLIDCQGRLDSGEGPPVEVNPVAGATNAALERMLRFQQLARGKVSELDQILSFFRIPLRA